MAFVRFALFSVYLFVFIESDSFGQSACRFAGQTFSVGDRPLYGNCDLVTANRNGGNVSVLIGNGDGTFAENVDYAVGGSLPSVAISDLENDLDLDLAVANESSRVSRFLRKHRLTI